MIKKFELFGANAYDVCSLQWDSVPYAVFDSKGSNAFKFFIVIISTMTFQLTDFDRQHDADASQVPQSISNPVFERRPKRGEEKMLSAFLDRHFEYSFDFLESIKTLPREQQRRYADALILKQIGDSGLHAWYGKNDDCFVLQTADKDVVECNFPKYVFAACQAVAEMIRDREFNRIRKLELLGFGGNVLKMVDYQLLAYAVRKEFSEEFFKTFIKIAVDSFHHNISDPVKYNVANLKKWSHPENNDNRAATEALMAVRDRPKRRVLEDAKGYSTATASLPYLRENGSVIDSGSVRLSEADRKATWRKSDVSSFRQPPLEPSTMMQESEQSDVSDYDEGLSSNKLAL